MHASKHHPNGGAVQHFDNERIEMLMREHQCNRDRESMSAIIELAQPRVSTLIRFYKTARYKSEDELRSDVNFKLMRAIPSFNPQKGTAFRYISQVITNVLCTSVSNARKDSSRHCELGDDLVEALPAKDGELSGRAATDDVIYRIKRGVRTTLINSAELNACRWYVESFLAGAFELRRHECADACMVVHQLSHSRSRELYDLVLLECRRVLYPDRPPRQLIAPGRLAGTRAQWMIRYAVLMNSEEFTKFFTLTKDLGPFVLVLVDPLNKSRRKDRSAQVTRRNVEFVLYGYPDAVPLFTGSISEDKEPVIAI